MRRQVRPDPGVSAHPPGLPARYPRMTRPATLAEVARRSAADPDWDHHLREFLDAFYGAHGDLRRQVAMVAEEPELLGDARADAFIGGVGEHLARRWGLPVPGWVTSPGRYLTEPLFVPDRAILYAYLRFASPVAFRNRMIFTGPEPLQRARFPVTGRPGA